MKKKILIGLCCALAVTTVGCGKKNKEINNNGGDAKGTTATKNVSKYTNESWEIIDYNNGIDKAADHYANLGYKAEDFRSDVGKAITERLGTHRTLGDSGQIVVEEARIENIKSSGPKQYFRIENGKISGNHYIFVYEYVYFEDYDMTSNYSYDHRKVLTYAYDPENKYIYDYSADTVNGRVESIVKKYVPEASSGGAEGAIKSFLVDKNVSDDSLMSAIHAIMTLNERGWYYKSDKLTISSLVLGDANYTNLDNYFENNGFKIDTVKGTTHTYLVTTKK